MDLRNSHGLQRYITLFVHEVFLFEQSSPYRIVKLYTRN